MEAACTSPGPRIWLIAPDWRTRALVRAQLLEEGYDVTAMEDWEALEALLREEGMLPRLVIAELTGDEPPAVLSLLRSLPVPRLVLRGARAPEADALRAAGIEEVLSRPFTVGEVVRRVLELVRAPIRSSLKGTPGKELLRFAGSLTAEDAVRMMEAIEAACERVDPDEW